MPARTDLGRHLVKEPLLPVYALVGPEPSLVNEAVAHLRSKVLTQAPEFNRNEFQADQAAIREVVVAASTLPMMAERRWVLLADIDRLNAKDQPALLRYLDNPSPTTVLCLAGTKIDGRTKLGSLLGSKGYHFALTPPRGQGLTRWLMSRAKSKGFAIDESAAQLLADLVGEKVGALDVSLEKLGTYAGERSCINSDDVEALIAPTRVHSIFELTDAIGRRDLPRATGLLRSGLGSGENALMILAMMVRQWRHLLRVKTMTPTPPSKPQVVKALAVPPFVAEGLLRQVEGYSEEELVLALEAAVRADARLKSSRLSPGILLDQLLLEVIDQGS